MSTEVAQMKRKLVENQGSAIGFVPRKRISEFTRGLYSPRHLANLDSQGRGPKGRVRIGGQVAYPVTELLAWLAARTEKVG